MQSNILDEIKARGITRLCHFTKSIKMINILKSDLGIVASNFIQEDVLNPNDEHRYDGMKDYVNCSIQYPNIWYLRKIKDKDPLFKEWVILYIDPILLTDSTTEFCFTNAAFRRGACISKGYESFVDMYTSIVNGNRTIKRPTGILTCCPTDDQAEVLIYKNIPRQYIRALVVPNEWQARHEVARLETARINIDFDIIIAPDLFTTACSDKVRNGLVPDETIYKG